MTDGKSFSFFLGGATPQEISSKEKPTLEYIILQNDFLHKKIKELENDLLVATGEKDTFEEENERHEKSIVALRGITINEYEMGNLLEQILHGYKIHIKEHEVLNYQYYKLLRNKNTINLLLSFLYFFSIIIIGIDFSVIFFLIIGFNSVINNHEIGSGNLQDLFNKRPVIKLHNIYKEKEKEYKELRKNQEYVSKLIENI